ncbi:MAG: S-layer homology domain-containing protein [Geitlerinemataceae cyanobacterium]
MSESKASPPAKRSKALRSDEWLALFVAFGTLGTLGATIVTRGDRGDAFNFPNRAEQQLDDNASAGRADSSADRDAEREMGDRDIDDADAADAANRRTSTTGRALNTIGSRAREAGALAAGAGALSSRGRGANSQTPTTEEARGDASGAGAIAGDDGATDAAAAGANGGADGETGGGPVAAEGSASVSENIAETAEAANFTDLPADRWSKPFIDGLSKRELVSGFPNGTFAPDRPVTRAELAAQIQKIFDRDENLSDSIAFSDVGGDYWARTAIDKSVEIGFLSGYPNARFAPERPVSRLEVAIALATGLGLGPSGDPAATLAVYSDAAAFPDWAKPKLAAATQAGLIVIDPEVSAFDPDVPASREVVAAMMYQALVDAGQAEPIDSDRLVRP